MILQGAEDALLVRADRRMALLQFARQVGPTQAARLGHGSAGEGKAFQETPAAPTASPSVAVWARRFLM